MANWSLLLPSVANQDGMGHRQIDVIYEVENDIVLRDYLCGGMRKIGIVSEDTRNPDWRMKDERYWKNPAAMMSELQAKYDLILTHAHIRAPMILMVCCRLGQGNWVNPPFTGGVWLGVERNHRTSNGKLSVFILPIYQSVQFPLWMTWEPRLATQASRNGWL